MTTISAPSKASDDTATRAAGSGLCGSDSCQGWRKSRQSRCFPHAAPARCTLPIAHCPVPTHA